MPEQTFFRQGTRWGVFLAILFTVCFLWLFIRGGGSELATLHNNLLALSFFGWSGPNFSSFLLGAGQSFIWGYVAVALWRLANLIVKK